MSGGLCPGGPVYGLRLNHLNAASLLSFFASPESTNRVVASVHWLGNSKWFALAFRPNRYEPVDFHSASVWLAVHSAVL